MHKMLRMESDLPPAPRIWRPSRPGYRRKSDTPKRGMYRALFKDWYATPSGRAQTLLRNAVRHSKSRGFLPPDLTVHDLLPILEAGVCQLSGLRFEWYSENKQHPLAPSLDRPRSDQPYSRNNFRVVCWAVNTGCAHWGLDTYLMVAARVIKNLNASPE
jgi:hypothetical protein